ncbi:MAG: dipicolinate synthase subunit DpsA [Ruminococcaceae bacterium]|nr:dipicolinate synthase subunit DpsA [Oscillospiraceae bacterium]
MDYNIALIGGDLRNAALASMLAQDGCNVKIFGIPPDSVESNKRISFCDNIAELFDNTDAVIGPVPVSRDKGETFNAPLFDRDIPVRDFISHSHGLYVFIGGKIPSILSDYFNSNNIAYEDILLRDDFAILNAVPTAEGTVQIAMEELPCTLWNMNVLVLGAGRVGRHLATLLQAMGAKVTVAVRKGKDAAWVISNRMDHCCYDFDGRVLSDYRLICNTVPAVVLDESLLSRVGENALIIDLASDNGGVDYCYALSHGIKVIHALSLPGKVAPETAAENLKRVIYNILAEVKKR